MRQLEKRLTDLLDRAAFLSLLALIAISPFIVAPRAADQFFLPKALFTRQMIVILVALAFLKLLHSPSGVGDAVKKAWGEHGSRFILLLMVFLSAAILSAASSADPYSAIPWLLDLTLGALLYMATLVVVDSEKRVKAIAYVFLLAGFFTGLMAAIQYYGYFPGVVRADSLMPANGRRVAVGLLGNSGISSAYLAATSLIAFGEIASLKKDKVFLKGPLLGLLAAVSLYGFALPRAMASAAGFIAGIAFFLGGSMRFLSRRRFWLAVACASMIAGAGLQYYSLRGYDVAVGAMRGDLTSALSNRGIIWFTAWKMAAEKPLLGWGIGRFKIDYYEYYGRALKDIGENSPIRPRANTQWETVHNEYLQLLSEMGLLGLSAAMIFLWAYFRAIGGLFRWAKKEPESVNAENCLRSIGLIAAFFSLLINAIASFPFHVAPTAAMALVVAAAGQKMALFARMGAGGGERVGVENGFASPLRGKIRSAKLGLAWAAATLTVVYAFINFSSAYSADVSHQRAIDYLSAHRKAFQEAMAKGARYFEPVYLRAAQAEMEKALRKDADNGQIIYLYGKALAMGANFDKAIAELKRARNRYRETHLDYDLGVVLEAKGELERAAVFYEKAISYNPYFEYPRRRLKEIWEKLRASK